MAWFSKHADQVRLLEDRTGSGKADHSTVFAGGFNEPLEGLAAGVLARDGKVWFTDIPNLWLLEDKKNTGVADVRTPLLTGFGVGCAFLGHDLHGLIFGPDGKLYFSIGDRGFNVTSQEGKQFTGLRTGGVFRCDPDGSNFEVVMRGLRNPQELAFDQIGNLFADDNNCDYGDDARLVYVLEGGDAGWNMAYQTMPSPYVAGPWFAERMWHLPHAGQPAWILPPVGKVGTGPAGFLFTSGSSLPPRYRNSFIMCNYTGNGGLETFHVKPKGAGYEIADYHDFLKPIRPTDVDLGPDGKLYISDFGPLDWSGKSTGGRIFTLFDQEKLNDPEVVLMKKVFAEGFAKQSLVTLGKLLAHPEMKLRLRAQYEIANRGAEGEKLFNAIALSETSERLSRLHAIWGLGQMARKNVDALKPVTKLLDDADDEVQTQAIKVIGDAKSPGQDTKLIPLLKSDSLRVRMFAAQALGKLKSKNATQPLFAAIRENKNDDPFLRHAIVTALAQIGDADAVDAKAKDESAAVRLAVLLVQRRLGDKRIVQFLSDADLFIRTEAARAIHDLPLLDHYAALAKALGNAANTDSDPLVRRAIDANFVLGQAESAKAVLNVAVNGSYSAAVRLEALAALRDWTDPPQRDRVIGSWRPLGKRDVGIIRSVVDPEVATLLKSTSGKLQSMAVALVGQLGVAIDEALIAEWVADAKKDVSTRTAALHILGERKSKNLEAALSRALKDANATVRAEAREVLAAIDPARGMAAYAAVLEDASASVFEQQRAILALPWLKSPKADELLDAWAVKLSAGKVPAELQLDVLDALKAAPTIARKLHQAQFEFREPKELPGKYRIALVGGNPEIGRELFTGHTAAQCIRCHTVSGHGGTAGPDLTQVATRNPENTREYLLESLVLPNAKIAVGYANVTFTLLDGRVVAGTILAEDKNAVTLQTPDGKKIAVAIADIESRTIPTSTMPAMDRTLTPREMRDLVAYLATLR